MTLSPGWEGQSPETQKMFRDLVTGAIERKVPCLNNPDPWVGYPEEDPPGEEEATRMCRGCPLLKECLAYAQAGGATYGVYGGRVFSERL